MIILAPIPTRKAEQLMKNLNLKTSSMQEPFWLNTFQTNLTRTLQKNQSSGRKFQYFLQVVKCEYRLCCLPFRSSYLSVVKDRFLPPPIPVVQTNDGLNWVADDKGAAYLTLCQNLAINNALAPSAAVYLQKVEFHMTTPILQLIKVMSLKSVYVSIVGCSLGL